MARRVAESTIEAEVSSLLGEEIDSQATIDVERTTDQVATEKKEVERGCNNGGRRGCDAWRQG